MLSEEYIMSVITEVTKYVSNEVNWIEACGIYMTKHSVDAETFAEIVKNSPKLFAEINQTAMRTKNVTFDYAVLPV